MAGLLAVLLGGLITVVTKQGTVTIETPERLTDAVTVKITPLAGGDKAVAVLDKQGNWTAKVAGGEYTLELLGGDDEFDLQDRTLTVSRFGTTLVRITHEPTRASSNSPDATSVIAVNDGADPSAGTAAAASQPATEYALLFDGHDDYVELPITYDGSHPLTIELFFNPQFRDSRDLINNADLSELNNHRGLELTVWIQGYWAFWLVAGHPNPTGLPSLSSNRVLQEGTWSSLSVVLDGNEQQMYMDGNLVGQKSGFVYLPSPRPLVLGAPAAEWQPRNSWFAGMIGGLRLSRVARTGDELVTADGLQADEHTIALYRFDQSEGDVLLDASGNGHDGRIHGAQWVARDTAFFPPPEVDPTTLLTDREIAAWYQSLGMQLRVRVNGSGTETRTGPTSPLPEEPFQIASIDTQRVRDLPPGVLEPLARLPRLSGLALRDANLSREDLLAVAHCGQLRTLDVTSVNVGDEALQSIAEKCRSLETLYLESANITPAGLAHLTHLPLSHLGVNTVPLDQQGLEHIAQIRSLRSINLANTDVGSLDLSVLSGLDKLRTLYLHASTLGDHNVPQLLRLPHLEHAVLHTTKLSHSGLRQLAGHSALRSLHVGDRPFTDDVVEALKLFKQLDILDVRGTRLSAETIDQLHQALPYCRIEWDGGVIEGDDPDRRAAAWVLSTGGMVQVAVPEGAATRTVAAHSSDEIPDTPFHVIQILLAGRPGVDEAALDFVPRLSQLQQISLDETAITDDSLALLGRCPALESVSLAHTTITDDGLRHLSQLADLDSLNLSGTPITADGLTALTGVPIRRLDLSATQIGGDDLDLLERFFELRVLSLRDNQRVGEKGMAAQAQVVEPLIVDPQSVNQHGEHEEGL